MKNPKVVYERFVKLKDVLEENFFGLYENEVKKAGLVSNEGKNFYSFLLLCYS